jgi:hypothetical protein
MVDCFFVLAMGETVLDAKRFGMLRGGTRKVESVAVL